MRKFFLLTRNLYSVRMMASSELYASKGMKTRSKPNCASREPALESSFLYSRTYRRLCSQCVIISIRMAAKSSIRGSASTKSHSQ